MNEQPKGPATLHFVTTVVPAYGRDYSTATAAMRDWYEGKDFRISDISSRWDGSYCSIADGFPVRIRYRLQRRTTGILHPKATISEIL